MDLSTTYLGMRLPNPFIVGAGPHGDDVDTARALEDAGASLLVLRSLYEEEITGAQIDAFLNEESHSGSFAEAETFAPDPLTSLGPDEYLEHLCLIKCAVSIPVMASLNGVTAGGWIEYAKLLETAGADGLELHVFHAMSDMTASAADVERRTIDMVREVRSNVRIPIAVKLTPLLTAFAQFAGQLDAAGADGLVLFTRFHRIDIDVDELEVVRTLPLSDETELALRLRGAAAIAGRVRSSIALTGGVYRGIDVIKATMAGAHATQLVSALLRHGPDHLRTIQREIESWMDEHEWSALDDMRGNMSLERVANPAEYERMNVRMALR